MSDIIFKPFPKQKELLKNKSRIKGGFAGKRCINPESKALTLDGLKAFGDISSKDLILSFDQKANQYLFLQNSGAFPKTKCSGYRVIHAHGEFYASAHHRILLSDYKYRSVLDLFYGMKTGTSYKVVTAPDLYRSNSESSQLNYFLNVQHYFQKLLNYLDHYGSYIRQYDQQLHKALINVLILFQQKFGALKLNQQYAYADVEYADVLGHMISKHNLGDPISYQSSNLDAQAPCASQFFSCVHNYLKSDICEQFLRSLQQFFQFQGRFLSHHLMKLCGLSFFEPKAVSAYSSNILAIEPVSKEQWFWDLSVPVTNNYIAANCVHHNSGKSQIGAIQSILWQETKPDWTFNGIDPYLGVIIAPTHDMLRRLSLKTFQNYAKPFIKDFNKSTKEVFWHDGSEVYGISAENPERLEGVKANWIWIDEAFQVSEQLFLEARARVADQKGYIICTGSLGVQYVNPKTHWIYKYFKEKPDENTACFEWATAENPYFPKDELESLKNSLDRYSYESMFQINWDVNSSAMVYNEFSVNNLIKNYKINESLPTYVSIDWGWAHQMACLFFQYDAQFDRVILFDEIVSSKMTLEKLYTEIKAKDYKIAGWCCDIAGNQEREQTGISNVRWFEERGVKFTFRQSAIMYGISLVRSYISTYSGQVKFFLAEDKCPKTLNEIKSYRYKEKDGTIVNELPVKENDDAIDALRYFFVNFVDKDIRNRHTRTIQL